jgi:hypothetical protein
MDVPPPRPAPAPAGQGEHYVRRGKQYISAGSVQLVAGEKLYQRSKPAGKFILVGSVKKERKSKNVSTSPKIH